MKIKASNVFKRNWKAIQQGFKILLNEGSSRSSKTWSFFLVIYLYARNKRNQRIIVLRDTAIACRSLVESEFKDWLNDPQSRQKQFDKGKITIKQLNEYLQKENLLQFIKVNLTRHEYTFPNGSTILFTGADNMSQVIGKENDLVWINEPYNFSEEVTKQLLKRLKGVMLLDWNPSQSHFIEKFKQRPDCITIHSTFLDNPFLADTVRNELLGAKPLLNEFFDIQVEQYKTKSKEYIENDLKGHPQKLIDDVVLCWNNENNGTANKYDWQVYGLGIKAEKPNKVYHKWQRISNIEFDKLPFQSYYGLDFGETNPTALVECKYNDGNFYFNELIYQPGKQIESLVQRLEFLGIEKGRDLIICDSASPDKIAELQKAGFYAIGAKKGPGSVVAGISFLGKKKVFVTNNSSNMINEEELYEWELDRYGLPTDKTIKKDDHILDAARYVADYLKVYLHIPT